MRPVNEYYTIFKIWENTHENYQNCLNLTQRRKKSLIFFFFMRKVFLHFWPCKRSPETKHCAHCSFHVLDHLQNIQTSTVLLSVCVHSNDSLMNSRAECKAQGRFQLPLPLCVLPRCQLFLYPSLPQWSKLLYTQKEDVHVHWSKNTVILPLPCVELWGGEQDFQP